MHLTERELQVLSELQKGHQNEKIAETLNVSVNTIKTHLARMYRKNKVKNRTELIIKSFNENEKL